MKGSELILLLSFVFISSITYSQSSQGFTVTGVSLINVLHPGQLLNASQPPSQAQWKITTVFNGGGQSLVANLNSSSINSRDSAGRLITSNYPLQLSGYTNPETAIYTISNQQPGPIYQFTSQVEVGSITKGFINSNGTSAASCPGGKFTEWDSNITVYPNWPTPKNITAIRVCIYEKQIASEYPLSTTPNIQFSSVLRLMANGQLEVLNLNSNATSAVSGDGLVEAQWPGSLVTGTAAPDGSQYVAISNQQNNHWDIQNINMYQGLQGYASHVASLATFNNNPTLSCKNYFSWNENQTQISQALLNIASCMNATAANDYQTNNQYAVSLLVPGQSIQGYSATQTNYNGGTAFAISLGNGTYTTNPQIILTLSGSFIGVVIPVGKPKILSVTSSPFNSGSTGKISVNVENIGIAIGSFYVTLSSCQGVAPTQSASNYPVQPGQSQLINVSIATTGINQTLNQECTVTVTDYNGGGSNSSQVNVVSKPANQCTPNTQIVQGSSICSCNSVNGVYQATSCKTCSNGVTEVSGQYICAGSSTTIGPTSSSNSNISTGNLTTVVANIAQVTVSTSDFVTCTPFVSDAINLAAPEVTQIMNFISDITGNTCG